MAQNGFYPIHWGASVITRGLKFLESGHAKRTVRKRVRTKMINRLDKDFGEDAIDQLQATSTASSLPTLLTERYRFIEGGGGRLVGVSFLDCPRSGVITVESETPPDVVDVHG